MASQIGVFYVPVEGVPGAYHAGLYYRDGNGTTTLEAFPEHRKPGQARGAFEYFRERFLGERHPDTPFGRIVTESGSGMPKGAIVNPLVEGLGLMHVWDGLKSTFDEVENEKYSYHPYHQNSNTVVAAALARNGVDWTPPRIPTNPRDPNFKHGDPPYTSDPNFPWVPGADRMLIKERDVQRPRYMVTPLGDVTGFPETDPDPRQQSEISRSLSPTGLLIPSSNTPADRGRVFEDLSAHRGFASAADSSRPVSPVLRALQKYKASAAPDPFASAPSSTASDFGSPHASIGVGKGIGSGIGGVLKWTGDGVIPTAKGSPLQPFLPSGRVAPDLPGENDSSSDMDEVSPPLAQDNRRYLSRRTANQGSAYDAGAPAVPFVSPIASLSPDRSNVFEDRAENWLSAADGPAPAPVQHASMPLGIVTGKPLSDWLLPPSIFGFPDRGDDGAVGGRASRDAQGTGIPMLDEYIWYLNREYPGPS